MKKYIFIVIFVIIVLGTSHISVFAEKSNFDKVEWDFDRSQVNIFKEKTYRAKNSFMETSESEGRNFFQRNNIYPSLKTADLLPSITPRAIWGADNRVKINNVNINPYKKIVHLYITYRNGLIRYGTGFLISNDRVATAGHGAYDLKYGFPKTIQVFAGMKDKKYVDSTVASKVSVPDGWRKGGKDEYDFGLIKLKKPLGKKFGYFSYGPQDLKNAKVSISGYPAENSDIKSGKFGSQYKHSGTIIWYNAYNIRYTIDTTGGQSGSPVFLNSNYKVVGIHTATFSNSQNGGTKINENVYKFLKN